MQTEIELAVTSFAREQRETLGSKLPKMFFVEDRSSNGYVLAIRNNSLEDSEDINVKLELFLKELLLLVDLIKDSNCIMRIAIFSSSVTTTLMLNASCLETLNLFNARLEMSVYPTDDSD